MQENVTLQYTFYHNHTNSPKAGNSTEVTDNLHSQQRSDRFKQQVSTKPEDEKTTTEVTHAEQTDASCSRYEKNQQRQPEREVEYHYFHIVQI